MKYQNLNSIVDVELAGCLDIANSVGNYRTIVHRLKLLLALHYNLIKSELILRQIEAEAEECFLPYHEYVINEMQYEIRTANSQRLDEEQELLLTQKWRSLLYLKFPQDAVSAFFDMLHRNRLARL